MNPMPDEIARTLCQQIRHENHHKWFSFARWQCWGCETFTQGVLTQMCLNSAPGNRGCSVLNDRYQKFLREIRIAA